VLFTDDALPGPAAGSTTVTFRRWKRRHAKVGGRFRTRDLWFEVDAVDVVAAASITDDVAELLNRLDRLDRASPRDPWTYERSPRGQALRDATAG
jgi:hypothetical protein